MKVLVSGSSFHGYRDTIARAFNEFGCEVKISNWPNLAGKTFSRFKLLQAEKINIFTEKYLNKEELEHNLFEELIVAYNRELLKEVFSMKPDLLLVINGNILLPDTLKKIRSNSDTILILWCYDSPLRFINVLNGGKFYHIFYTYEPSDIPNLLKYDIQANLLLMAYDSTSYFMLKDRKITYDLSFVGSLGDYPDRKNILEMIISNYNTLKLDVWGAAWTWYNPFLIYEYKVKRRILGKHLHNYNLPPNEINKIYNSSCICLNMHHRQSKEGMNPRTFEILGAGGFQLVDYKSKMDDVFDIGNEIICYYNESDLLNKIRYYLENEDERKRIAKKGYDLVKKKHTYKHRVETILNDMKKIT